MSSGFTLTVVNKDTGEKEEVSGWDADWIIAILRTLPTEQYDKVIDEVKAMKRRF